MATPPKITQAKALLAVLAGAAMSRRKREYWVSDVLRSSLYAFVSNDEISSSGLFYSRTTLFTGYEDSVTNSGVDLSFISLRSAKVDYDADKHRIKSNAIELGSINLKTTQIKYKDIFQESIFGAAIEMVNISVERVLIRHVSHDENSIKCSGIALESISLN